jgi:hypothetical protein
MREKGCVSITTAVQSPDLRDQAYWRLWVKLLPGEEREMILPAAMQYVGPEDTLVLLFPFDSQGQIGEDGFGRIVDAIRDFYNAKRQQWMVSLKDIESAGKPPLAVTMPRILIELAPPRTRNH